MESDAGGRATCITAPELADRLNEKQPLVAVDCRQGCSRTELALPNSVALVAPFLLRRRLRTGCCKVSEVVSSATGDECDALDDLPVVLYDDGDSDSLAETMDTPLGRVLKALVAHGSIVFYLKGGLQAFRRSFEHLCVPAHGPAACAAPSGGPPTPGVSVGQPMGRIMLPVRMSSSGEVDNSTQPIRSASLTLPLPPSSTVLQSHLQHQQQQQHNVSQQASQAQLQGRRVTVAASGRLGGYASLPTAHMCRRPETPVVDLHGPMSEILPHLFIGNRENAHNTEMLLDHGVTGILNCARECHRDSCPFQLKQLDLCDNMTQEVLPYVQEAVDFIESIRVQGGKVLVHCRGGISRSVTLTIAYIMRTCGVDLNTAYAQVRQARPHSSPNINFMQQLIELERELVSEGLISAPQNRVPQTPDYDSAPTTAPAFPITTSSDRTSNATATATTAGPVAMSHMPVAPASPAATTSSSSSNSSSSSSSVTASTAAPPPLMCFSLGSSSLASRRSLAFSPSPVVSPLPFSFSSSSVSTAALSPSATPAVTTSQQGPPLFPPVFPDNATAQVDQAAVLAAAAAATTPSPSAKSPSRRSLPRSGGSHDSDDSGVGSLVVDANGNAVQTDSPSLGGHLSELTLDDSGRKVPALSSQTSQPSLFSI